MDMATKDDVSRELESMKIVSLYRICGGTAKGREREVKELSGAYYMFATQVEGIESAIWLYKDSGAPRTIPWDKIASLTELGNTVGHPDAQTVTLPDPLDTRYTTYEDREEQLVINLLPAIFEDSDMNEKGRESLEWILESRARHTCVVQWPSGAVDATCLPDLPAAIK